MRRRTAWLVYLGVALLVFIALLFALLGDVDSGWSSARDKSYSGWEGGGDVRQQLLMNDSKLAESIPSYIRHEADRDGSSRGGSDRNEEQEERRGPGIIELHFMGRLGNNLFEYAAARALADRMGWALSLRTASGNKKKFGTLLAKEGMACFPGIRGVGPDVLNPEMRNLPILEVQEIGARQEFGTLPRRIVMQAWYQNYQLFSEEKDRLRKIMAFNPACCGETAPGPNDMAIHYRNYRKELTSVQYEKLHFKDLGYQFYDSILREAAASPAGRPDTVWIVGEFDDTDEMVKRLRSRHDNIRIAEMVDNQFHAFCFLARAPRLVMAHSTFSWWTAFLGNATEIHYPLQPRGVTTPKVMVDDEPRYVYRNDAGKVISPH